MKEAALLTSLAIMFLPLILMVLVTVLSICLVASLCLFIPGEFKSDHHQHERYSSHSNFAVREWTY